MNDVTDSRYAKQILFHAVGAEGQERISHSTVTIVGLGALGTVSSSHLCRAGVGRLRLIDRDFVEISNLQRQSLYDERDAAERLPKAVAAARSLGEVNSQVEIEPLIEDVTPRNVAAIVAGSSLVLDGTDNLETRLLLNDACLKVGVPWIYAGALGAVGMTMTIVPPRTPCLRCLIDQVPAPGTMPSCDTEGVLGMTTGAIASVQSAEALRLLVGLAPAPGIVFIDVWQREFETIEFSRRPDCPACGHGDYSFLAGTDVSWTTVLCGRNAVQIVPPTEQPIPLAELETRLKPIGQVNYNGYLLSFRTGAHEIVLFPTGRAIVRGTQSEAEARSLYARYIGT